MPKFINISVVLALLLCLISGSSRAFGTDSEENDALVQVNRSITELYATSEECKKYLIPSTEIYINAIKNYLDKLYPDGAGYWVVSPESKYESNKGSCITKLEANLLRYQYSLRAFRYAYPKLLQPPVLFAYRWREYNPETKEETGFYQPTPREITAQRIQ